MRRVVLDYLRRYWWEYALAAGVMVPLWMASASRGTLSVSMAMAAAAAMGPMVTLGRLAPREVHNLPLSDAEIWRAQWIVAVPVTALVMSVSMAAGVVWWRLLSGRPEPGLEAIVLSTLYVLLYVGCVIGLPPLLGKVGRLANPSRSGVVRYAAEGLSIGIMVVYVFCILWPFALGGYLPTTFEALSGPAVAGLLAAACVAWFVARSRPVQIVSSPERVARTPPPEWASRHSMRDPFTGVTLYLWRAWFETAWPMAVLLVGLGGFWYLIGSPADVFPFSADAKLPFLLPVLGFMVLASRDGAGGLNATGLLRSSLRQFRTLPVGTDAVATLMVARRLIAWVNLWGLTLLAHLALVGPVDTFRLELLAVIVGLDALLDGLRIRSSHPVYLAAVALVVVPSLAVSVAGMATRLAWLFAGLPSVPVVGPVCLGGLLGGWLMLRHAIDGKGSLYWVDAVSVGPFWVRVPR